jgi:hypothetical protein
MKSLLWGKSWGIEILWECDFGGGFLKEGGQEWELFMGRF